SHHELAVRAQRLAQRLTPAADFRFAPGEELADERLESLRQGGVGNIAPVLLELARCEQPARRNDCLVQLVDHRGFADAGIARDEDELRRAVRYDALERAE